LVFLRNANSFIRDREYYAGFFTVELDTHCSTFWRIFDSVGEEIGEDLPEQFGIKVMLRTFTLDS
jgi:hypothetical protein